MKRLVTGLLALSLFLAACGQDSDQQKDGNKEKDDKAKTEQQDKKTNDSSKDKKDNKDDSKDVNKDKIIVQTITSNNLIQMQQTMTKTKQIITNQVITKRIIIKNQVTLHHIMDKMPRRLHVKFIRLMEIKIKLYSNCQISKQL